jgi:hypothetical protein
VIESARNVFGIVPSADPGHVDYVRLVDFSLNGGHFNPLAAKVEAETKKR